MMLKIKAFKCFCWFLKIEARGLQTFQLTASDKSPKRSVGFCTVSLRPWQIGPFIVVLLTP